MKIETNREVDENGNLKFTIIVSEPHVVSFSSEEKDFLNIFDICEASAAKIGLEDSKIKQDVARLIYAAKKKVFDRFLNKINFEILNTFEPRFKHICQEMYNWIYDAQAGSLKQWLQEFDPQRSKYYFDNDKNIEKGEDDDEDGDGDDL